MEDQKKAPLTTGASGGQHISVAGGTYRILIAGKDTGGEFATIDMMIPPGGGPGPHSHASFHETFYVTEGEVEVKSEAGTYTATKGSYVVVPKGGIVHKFKNKTDKVAQLLCTVIPAGLEDMFIEMGTPVTEGTFLPPPPMNDAAGEKIKAIAAKYGQTLYPPDYLG